MVTRRLNLDGLTIASMKAVMNIFEPRSPSMLVLLLQYNNCCVLYCITLSVLCFQASAMNQWVFVEMIWTDGEFKLKVDGTMYGPVDFVGKQFANGCNSACLQVHSHVCVCMCVCARARVFACVRGRVCACAFACVRAYVYLRA